MTNDRRCDENRGEIDWKKTIVTSNIRELPENAMTVNYSALLNTSLYASDSAGMMLLKLLVKCTVKDVFLAGMDGFCENPLSNYYDVDYAVPSYDIPLDIKNEEVNIQLNKRAKELNLVFVTQACIKFIIKRMKID